MLSQKFMCDPKKPEYFKTTIHPRPSAYCYSRLPSSSACCTVCYETCFGCSAQPSSVNPYTTWSRPASCPTENHFVACWKLFSHLPTKNPPSFQKSNFLRFTYFPLFLNWHPPYFRGACCASTLSTGKCWCRQFPPSHSCRFLKAPPPDTFSDSVFLSAVGWQEHSPLHIHFQSK